MTEPLYSCQLPDGAPVDLILTEGNDPDEMVNQGFQHITVTAYEGDEKLAYIRLTFIDGFEFEKAYPSIFHFGSRFLGRPFGLNDFGRTHAVPFEDMSEDDFHKFKPVLIYNHLRRDCSAEQLKRVSELPRDEFLSFAEKTESGLELQKRMQDFIFEREARPMVSYIGAERSVRQKISNDNRGRGLGFLLYAAGSQACWKRGMVLHASNTQSKKAQNMWQRFENSGWVIHNKNIDRRYLDPDLMPGPEEAHEMLCRARELAPSNTP